MVKFLMASLLLLSTVAIAQLPERLDSMIRATTQANQPGAALLVVMDGKTIYQHSYGLANVETKSPITTETNFRMASVSKQFTAMGILLLEQDKKLSLDDLLVRFFPEFNATVGRKVRIRHLLTHTSGLLDYESVMNPKQREQLADADVLALLKGRDSLYFEPGSQFRYSNSAYCLLALLIERVANQPFASFIKQRIFQPLNMTNSVVYEAGKPMAHRAMGYAQNKAGAFVFSDQSITSATKGDGGVYTSLTDYRKWNDALTTNKLLDLNAALVRTGKAISTMPDQFYGLGWFFWNPSAPRRFHSGSTCGFNNYVISIPDKQFLLVYFTNRANSRPGVTALLKVLAEAGQPDMGNVIKLDELTQ